MQDQNIYEGNNENDNRKLIEPKIYVFDFYWIEKNHYYNFPHYGLLNQQGFMECLSFLMDSCNDNKSLDDSLEKLGIALEKFKNGFKFTPFLNKYKNAQNPYQRLFVYFLIQKSTNYLFDLKSFEQRFEMMKMICQEYQSISYKITSFETLQEIAKENFEKGNSEWIFFLDFCLQNSIPTTSFENKNFDPKTQGDFEKILQFLSKNKELLSNKMKDNLSKLLISSCNTLTKLKSLLKTKFKRKTKEEIEFFLQDLELYQPLIAKQSQILISSISISNWDETIQVFKEHDFLKKKLYEHILNPKSVQAVASRLDQKTMIKFIHEIILMNKDAEKIIIVSLCSFKASDLGFFEEILQALTEKNLNTTDIIAKALVPSLFEMINSKWNDKIGINDWYDLLDDLKTKFESLEQFEQLASFHDGFFKRFPESQVFRFDIDKSNLSFFSKDRLEKKTKERISQIGRINLLKDGIKLLSERIVEDSYCEEYAIAIVESQVVSFKDIGNFLIHQSRFWSLLFSKIKRTKKMEETANYQEVFKQVHELINSFVSGEITIRFAMESNQNYHVWKELLLLQPENKEVFDQIMERINTWEMNKKNLAIFVKVFVGEDVSDFEDLQQQLVEIDSPDKLNVSDLSNPNFYGPLEQLIEIANKFSNKSKNVPFVNYLGSVKPEGDSVSIANEIENIYKDFFEKMSDFDEKSTNLSLEKVDLFWSNITKDQINNQIEMIEKECNIVVSKTTYQALEDYCKYKEYADLCCSFSSLIILLGFKKENDPTFVMLENFVAKLKDRKTNIYNLHEQLVMLRYVCLDKFQDKGSKIFVSNLSKCSRLVDWLKTNFRENLNAVFLSLDDMNDQYLSTNTIQNLISTRDILSPILGKISDKKIEKCDDFFIELQSIIKNTDIENIAQR